MWENVEKSAGLRNTALATTAGLGSKGGERVKKWYLYITFVLESNVYKGIDCSYQHTSQLEPEIHYISMRVCNEYYHSNYGCISLVLICCLLISNVMAFSIIVLRLRLLWLHSENWICNKYTRILSLFVVLPWR